MQNWKGLMIAAVVTAIIVAVFVKYSSDRLDGPSSSLLDNYHDSEDEQFARLIGQPAPDFQGELAINGKPIKLSDLRGKVVLVDFWAVWCDPCIKAFPHLREWRKKYGGEGLEIVGLTEPTPKTHLEQFAADHNLEHLLMTMSGPAYSRTNQAYGVQGIPQVVLVDRQGVVRMVRVGLTKKKTQAIEAGIKKLLADKA